MTNGRIKLVYTSSKALILSSILEKSSKRSESGAFCQILMGNSFRPKKWYPIGIFRKKHFIIPFYGWGSTV